MKLVSTVKLKKWKNKMMNNRDYANSLKEITDTVLSCCNKVKTPFNVPNEKTNKNIYVVISSTLGLCGSYNNNIFKALDETQVDHWCFYELKKKGAILWSIQELC